MFTKYETNPASKTVGVVGYTLLYKKLPKWLSSKGRYFVKIKSSSIKTYVHILICLR